MPAKKYKVTLSSEERAYLRKLISTGKGAARKLAHARILLACEESGERRRASDTEVAAAVHVSRPTVERVRKAFVEEGLERALNAKRPRQTRPPVFDGESEAKLLALACSEPPQGRSRWTMWLLAERLVELQVFESISHETVRQVLKKRAQALVEGMLVHPGSAERRVCLRDGGCLVGLPAAGLRTTSPDLHERDKQAARQRDAVAAA